MKIKLITIGAILLGCSVAVFTQSRGTPSQLRIKVDANGSLIIASASQVNPVTSVQFNNARLAVDASGNLLVVGGGSFSTICSGSSTTQILFNDAGACAGDAAMVFTKSTAGRQYVAVTSNTGPALKLGGDDTDGSGATLILASDGQNASQPELQFWSSNGTMVSPTANSAGDSINLIKFFGYDGTSFRSSARIVTAVPSSGTVSTNHVPGEIKIYTSSDIAEDVLSLTVGNALLQPTGDILVANGKALKSDTTTAHTMLISGFDVNAAAYIPFITVTNANTPTFIIAPSGDGTVSIQGTYKSNDGSSGVTVSACTSFKNGLCVAGT